MQKKEGQASEGTEPNGGEANLSSLTRRPFTVPLRHGSLQSRLRLRRGALVAGCEMRASERGP